MSTPGRVFVSASDGTVAALDSATGTPHWTQETGGTAGAPFHFEGELLVPTVSGSLPVPSVGASAFDPATGEPGVARGGTLMAAADGELVVQTLEGGPGNSFQALSWGDRPRPVDLHGRPSVTIVGDWLMWVDVNILGFGPNCPPIDALPEYCTQDWAYYTGVGATTGVAASGGTTAVVTDNAGTVASIDVRTGAEIWRATVGAGIPGKPAVVVDDTVFVATTDGRLVALAADGCGAPTCNPRWEAPLPGAPSAGPVVGGDVVYATTTGGQITAYPAAGCGAATCTSLVSVSVGAEAYRRAHRGRRPAARRHHRRPRRRLRPADLSVAREAAQPGPASTASTP